MNKARACALAALSILCYETQYASAAAETPIGIILAAGDISTCGDDKPWKQYANKTAEIIRTIRSEASSANPAIPVKVLALGDLAYGKGTSSEFDCFAKRWSGFDRDLLPVPGNHEYMTADAAPYFEHFKDNPLVQQNGEHKGYFAISFPAEDGPWLLIGLNADIKGHDAMSDQLTWLKNNLSTSANQHPCVLAFWHEPTFSSGRHGHDYKTEEGAPLTEVRPMQDALRILYDHGASVVVAGHDHNYEQFARHDADGKPAVNGIRSFVVGTGGSILTQDRYDNLAPNSEGGSYGRTKGKQGVLEIKLFRDRYEWDFLAIDTSFKLPLKTVKDGCAPRKVP